MNAEELSFDENVLSAPVSIENDILTLVLYATAAGAVRIQIDEKTPRWKVDF